MAVVDYYSRFFAMEFTKSTTSEKIVSMLSKIFRDFNFLGEDKVIFTMDITSLYTVILDGEGLLALKHFLIYAQLRKQARKHHSAWLNWY